MYDIVKTEKRFKSFANEKINFGRTVLLTTRKQSKRVSENLATEIAFNSASEERPPCSVRGRKCSRSARLFIFQSIVVFILILTSVVCIIL